MDKAHSDRLSATPIKGASEGDSAWDEWRAKKPRRQDIQPVAHQRRFFVGTGDSDWPEGAEKVPLLDPPAWQLCPNWRAAMNGLTYGQAEPLAKALDCDDLPHLDAYATVLVPALRGDPRLPFKLVIKGYKHHGRPKNGTRTTNEKLAKQIEQGALRLAVVRRWIAAALRGADTLRYRIVAEGNTGGRSLELTVWRDLLFAVQMSQDLSELQDEKKHDRDAWRAKHGQYGPYEIAVEMGGMTAATRKAAYNRYHKEISAYASDLHSLVNKMSEEAFTNFDGWLNYQGVDAATVRPEELAIWRRVFDDATNNTTKK
jgi:hypothetical protein